MTVDMSQIAAPLPSQLPAGWLIAANEVLALSSADLQLFIHEEQISNPALEVEDRPVCPGCGRALHNQHCPHCQVYSSPAESGSVDAPLVDERTLEITFRKDRVNAGQVLASLTSEGLAIVDVSTRDPDLEDVFLSLVSADRETA